MYFELMDFFWLFLVSIIIWYWINAQKMREFALSIAHKECNKHQLQLLDASVGLKKLRLSRAGNGQLCFVRHYGFEFSATGDERYQGQITMAGFKIEEIHLQPHRIV